MGKLEHIPVSFDAPPSGREAALMFVIEDQKNTISMQAKAIAKLERNMAILQKALFGPKSERVVDINDECQGEFDDLLKEAEELNADIPADESETEDVASSNTAAKKRRKRRSLQELMPADLPREEVYIDLANDKKFGKDGLALEKIGEDRVEKLAYKPGHWYVKVFVYPKYANPDDALDGVKRAPAPDFAIPGGSFDESFYAWMVYAKYFLHLPHYRLEDEAKSIGFDLSRQSMSASNIKVAEVLRPLVELMKQDILSRNIAFTDETPVKMLVPGSGKTQDTYAWVYVGGGNGPPYRVFEFAPGRDGEYPQTFFKDFHGYIHADAFSGYKALFEREDVHECACWMHIRRKYYDSKDAPTKLRLGVLRKIRNIYRYERIINNLDREKQGAVILRIRREKIEPIIDELLRLTTRALADGEVMCESGFAGAISYMHNRGDALKTFLNNPWLNPDNGESERALRPVSIGRKNWLFFGSEKGGQAAATLLSLVQTCRGMKINGLEYLEDVLRRINGHPHSKLHELLPGNWKKAESYYN
jgi:transposase